MDLYTVRKSLAMGVPLTNIKLRVTDYARVSTTHEEQKKSLKNQVEHFEQYIKENPNWTYIKGYVDDGITGTSDIKRDHFMQMIEDARLGKFDLIVTKEISRFSRNTLDSIKYTRQLLSYGVAVFFVNDNINTALPDSELRLTIMASMAQDEVRRLSERVKFGMNRAIERGEILGNDLLYGYKKNKETGRLRITFDEAKIVRKIYEMYAIEEFSLSKIAKTLNEENIKTGEGNKWCISTISRMIENPKYKGYYCGKKSEIVDYMTKKVTYLKKEDWIIYEDKKRIPPIIEEELWERANKRLLSRKKSFQKRKVNKGIYKNRYLYSAKLICKDHKEVFHRRLFRKDKKDVTWVCAEYLKSGKKVCDSPNIRESELNTMMKDIIAKIGIDMNDVVKILMKYYQNVENDAVVHDEMRKKERELDKLYAKKDKLLELNLQNRLSNEEFYERNTLFNKKIKEIRWEVNQLRRNKKENIHPSEELTEIVRQKVHEKSTLYKVIEFLLNHMIVSKIGHHKNQMELTVFLSNIGSKESKNRQPLLRSSYEFKRGYDTKGTKRYHVYYQVNCYLCQ